MTEINGNEYDEKDISDLKRLQSQLLSEEKFVFTIEQCANIWMNYSNDLSASWLYFPKKDEDILLEIKASDFFTSFLDYANN